MPIYEYMCPQCGHEFEVMQKITEAPVKQCPKCLEDSVIKMVSAAGFQLKGDGWYVTDYKNKAKKPDKEEAKKEVPAKTETKEKATKTKDKE